MIDHIMKGFYYKPKSYKKIMLQWYLWKIQN